MKYKSFYLLTIVLLFLSSIIARADYFSEELFMIKWGDASDQLAISEETVNGAGQPDEDIAPSYGPSMGFYDENGYFVFSSYGMRQLKVFDLYGNLISDLLGKETSVDSILGGRTVSEFIIDTNSLIYLVAFPGLPTVPIINYNGDVVDSLMPFGHDSNVSIIHIQLNPGGEIVIGEDNPWMVTYINNMYNPGGSLGFLASDGSYYSVRQIDPEHLRFNKYKEPDTAGATNEREFTEIEYRGLSLYMARILGGGDGEELYVDIIEEDQDNDVEEIWKLDLDYGLLDRLVFPPANNIFNWGITPFVSRDGIIFEFRCLDDGLHVVKWTKQ